MLVNVVARRLGIPPRVKPALLRLRDYFLHLEAQRRNLAGEVGVLPHFVIIGAQKAGTTFLYEKLCDHPAVARALTKEVHFYDLNFRKGIAWYRGHFAPLEPSDYGDEAGRITGEATPYYLYHPHVARRLRGVQPMAKLILLLRNPVRRAYSHYHHEVRLGFETLSFEEALHQEPSRLAGEAERLQQDETYSSFNHQHYAYLDKGKYAPQLERWLSLFPREQLLVLSAEEFYNRTPQIMRQVTAFLGVPYWEGWQFEKPLSSRYAKMDAQLRQRLACHFRPYNEQLYDLLGRDLQWGP